MVHRFDPGRVGLLSKRSSQPGKQGLKRGFKWLQKRLQAVGKGVCRQFLAG